MNAKEMTFGIEIEAMIPVGTLLIGPHGAGLPIAALPGWKADRDPSIRASRGFEACEFVSPVYRDVEGVRQMINDIAAIKRMGAKVNDSCGLHIHIGFDRTNVPAVTRLTALVSNFEVAIFAATGTKKRERGRWCRGFRRYGAADRAIQSASGDRYHVCNLRSEHPTVEFRAFGASLNSGKIVAYVRLCLGLVERALTARSATVWTPPQIKVTSPCFRKGAGQTALTRLFYRLGWTKGDQKYVFGDVTDQSLPDLDRSKNELRRLAKKYDAQP